MTTEATIPDQLAAFGINSVLDIEDIWQFKSEQTPEGERVWCRITLADGRQLVDTHVVGHQAHITSVATEYRTIREDLYELRRERVIAKLQARAAKRASDVPVAA